MFSIGFKRANFDGTLSPSMNDFLKYNGVQRSTFIFIFMESAAIGS